MADDEDYVYDDASGEWVPASQVQALPLRMLSKCAMLSATFWPTATR